MKWVGLATLALALVVGAFVWQGDRRTQAAEQAERQAQDHARRADAERREAEGAEAQALAAAARVAKADAEVTRLSALVAQFRAKSVALPGPEPLSNVGLAGLDTLKDALIEAQATEIVELKGQVALERQRGDHHKAEADARFQHARCLELALEAQKAANRGAYWRGFRHGFVAGFGSGNVTGGYVGFQVGGHR